MLNKPEISGTSACSKKIIINMKNENIFLLLNKPELSEKSWKYVCNDKPSAVVFKLLSFFVTTCVDIDNSKSKIKK